MSQEFNGIKAESTDKYYIDNLDELSNLYVQVDPM